MNRIEMIREKKLNPKKELGGNLHVCFAAFNISSLVRNQPHMHYTVQSYVLNMILAGSMHTHFKHIL